MTRMLCLLPLVAIVPLAFAASPPGTPLPLQAVPFHQVVIDDPFWSPRLKTNREVTLEANLRQCEVTGRLKNFAVAGKLLEGKHEGQRYNDSDVYKVLEGAAYCLKLQRDLKLEEQIDQIIDWIAAAQQPDGYLNTYFTLVKPEMKWKDIQHGHELYCGGHLIEAAVAYHQATGKRKLLDVAIKFADCMDRTFGPGKRPEPCGHEEIELALIKLWRHTKEERYLKLAAFFLDARGKPNGGRKLFGDYAQDHIPLREQREVVGHAVRAMYLYCGMADVAAATGDQSLMKPLDAIWRDVTERKMYVTGGIGPSASNEGFTRPYDLPNDTAYAETCAAIGMALWNHRMFLMTGEGKYADVLEREVYNGLLSGVSRSGDQFFYDNPLGSKGDKKRVPWFDCSCCPTNIVRYLGGMGERCYATRGTYSSVWTVLYASGTAEIDLPEGKVKLSQTTRYPWDGKVQIRIESDSTLGAIQLRIPAWAKRKPSIAVKDKTGVEQNYLVHQAGRDFMGIVRTWAQGDILEVDFPLSARRVYADPNVKTNAGRVALMRGPVVYCLEGCDHGGQVRNLILPKDAAIQEAFDPHLLGGVVKLTGTAQRVSLNAKGERELKSVPFTAIPYFAWANRQQGEMVVWLPERAELAEAK